MVESLRGLGYSPATAIADIIDNSIAAGATEVDLIFKWDVEASSVAVLDNGHGMNAGELDTAMRLGERSPLETRDATDLGRFGLGLKTASFSQARRLTVASKRAGYPVECLRWDLDLLSTPGDEGWHLYEGAHAGSEPLLEPLSRNPNGTIVLWEILDRIVTRDFAAADMLSLIDRVEQHLSMTFHRYLEHGRLALRINDVSVKPWDPFMSGHPGKPWSPPPVEIEKGSGVFVQCHVLPHKDKLSDKEYEEAAGPEGWTSQQGFYVYRNERLLMAGGWLGLGIGRQWTRDEPHRLGRIRLDIPNSQDSEWKLDIRKSTARAPIRYRSRLTRLAEETRNRARQVFAHRGQPTARLKSNPVEAAWAAERTGGGMRYKVCRQHEAIRAVLDNAGDLRPQVEAMLRIIEETVPVQRIWLDTAEEKEAPLTGFAGQAPENVKSVLDVMYRTLRSRNGLSAQAARERLSRTEPFNLYPALIAALPDE